MMLLAENLRKVREANGYSGAEVARMLGIGESAYRNYEAGLREMPMRIQERFADAMGVDLDLLYEESDACVENMLACAFRIDRSSERDSREIIAFKRLVKSYLKMERLAI